MANPAIITLTLTIIRITTTCRGTGGVMGCVVVVAEVTRAS